MEADLVDQAESGGRGRSGATTGTRTGLLTPTTNNTMASSGALQRGSSIPDRRVEWQGVSHD